MKTQGWREEQKTEKGRVRQIEREREQEQGGVLPCKGKGEVFPSSRSGAGLSLCGMWLFEVASWEVFLKGSSLAGAGWHSPTSARDVTNTLNSSAQGTTYTALSQLTHIQRAAEQQYAQVKLSVNPKLGHTERRLLESEGELRANHRGTEKVR